MDKKQRLDPRRTAKWVSNPHGKKVQEKTSWEKKAPPREKKKLDSLWGEPRPTGRKEYSNRGDEQKKTWRSKGYQKT